MLTRRHGVIWLHRVLIVMGVALLAACATTETVSESRGQGATRVFGADGTATFSAVLAAARAKELDVLEQDRTGGRVLLSHGVTWLSWGERIAVFLRARTPDSTEVEVVSKAVMSPLNFPPDWQTILLDEIAVQLRGRK